MSKSRNWVFTRQTTQSEAENFEAALTSAAAFEEPFNWHADSTVNYVSYQIERCPKTGKLHVQGFIQLSTAVRMQTVKNKIGNEPHLEIAKDPVKAAEYTQKAETRVLGPWEHGKKPLGKGKKSTPVMEEIYKAVKTGTRSTEMFEKNPGWIAHDRAIKTARHAINECHSDRQRLKSLRVIVSYGETDLGKTYSAINYVAQNGDYYKLTAPTQKGGKLWFDGYEGQKTLIMDDWDGQCCSIAVLKNLLDVYKLQVEIKGGYTWAEWETVVITSNQHPRNWFLNFDGSDNSMIVRPLARRITEIRHYLERSLYQIVDWDEEPQGDVIQEIAPSVLTPTTADSDQDTQEDIMLVNMQDTHTATGL